jgi:hypothetical protein
MVVFEVGRDRWARRVGVVNAGEARRRAQPVVPYVKTAATLFEMI